MNYKECKAMSDGRTWNMTTVGNSPGDDETLYFHHTTNEENEDIGKMPIAEFLAKYRGIAMPRKTHYIMCKQFVEENAHRYEGVNDED